MSSAISGYISQIQNAVYGEQVRSAIVSALEACYSDVENPDLQSAAFQAAIEAAYEDGILDITEVTQVSQMTNENIIYRYMGTQAGYMANTLYYYNGSAWVPLGSGVLTASTAAGMTNTSAIYKYTGSESGYTTNALYFYNGTAWEKIASGDVDVGTDKTLSIADVPADSKTVGDFIGAELIAARTAILNATLATGYFDPTTGAVSSNANYKYTEDYFPVSYLAYFKSVEFHTQYIASVVFYDAEKAVLSVVGGTASQSSSYIITSISAPSGAVYFRISQPNAYANPFPITFHSLSDLFASADDTDLPADDSVYNTSQGGIRAAGGAAADYNHWKNSDYIRVIPGSRLWFTGCGNIGGNATLTPLAFYDADKNFVSSIDPASSTHVHIYNAGWKTAPSAGTSMNAGYIIVPMGAAYCRLGGYLNLFPQINYVGGTKNQWMGAKCAFFGDSITAGIESQEKYCNFLAMLRGIIPANYAVNGSVLVTNGMERVQTFASDYADADDPDAFFFAYGTNDWTGNKPLGDWYEVAANGTRTLTTDTTTFKGVLSNIVTYIKTNYDGARIVLLTPIRRGAGSYASDLTRNNNNNYLSDFVDAIKEAKDVLGVEVIDLYGESGLNPNINPSTKYFTPNDRLHPNAVGHLQIARTISAKLDGISLE